MKIGILTFHMAHNCGAMLQAYALCRSIARIPSCQCEIIDYRLPDIYNKYQQLLHSAPIEPRRLKFERYIDAVLPTSARVENLLNAKRYHMYVLGGDQIWNPDITRGYKGVYFAEQFPPDSYCIAYAASTGRRVMDLESFSRRLRHFSAIGVRESWLKQDLAGYYPREIIWCLDPVLLIEPEEWTSLGVHVQQSGHILIYAFKMSEAEYQRIEDLAGWMNLKVVELVTHQRPMRESIIYEDDYGPEEFVEYIRNAAYIYTDSYHGVLFSIIFGIPYDCLTENREQNERILDVHMRLAISVGEDGFCRAGELTAKRLYEGRNISIQFLERMVDRAGDGQAVF